MSAADLGADLRSSVVGGLSNIALCAALSGGIAVSTYTSAVDPEESKCYEECPSYSVKSPDNLCLECTGMCATCENIQSQCTSCKEGTFLHKADCIEDCPFLTWKDRTNRKCMSVG